MIEPSEFQTHPARKRNLSPPGITVAEQSRSQGQLPPVLGATTRLALLLLAFLTATTIPATAAETLVDSYFGYHGPLDQTQAHRGTLPAEWGDDSGTRFRPSYEYGEDEDRSYLSVDYSGADRGPLILYTEIPQHRRESFFRAVVSARSEDLSSLRVGIRTRIGPHTYYADAAITLDENWIHTEIEMPRVSPAGERIELVLEIPGPGVVEIESVSLERRDRSDKVAEVLRTTPDALVPNLLRITRFPLGLQSGMALSPELCDENDVHIATDTELRGPSQAPTLKIESEEDFAVYFPPFVVELDFDPHRAAVSLRGNAQGRVVVTADGRDLADRSFSANPGRWTRVEIPFQPDEIAAHHALRIEGTGRLWVDALQVSHGDRETRYATRGEAEIALAVPDGDASASRILFADEPPKIEYAITGDAYRKNLRARVSNLYGDVVDLPDVFLQQRGFLQPGSFEIDVFPEKELGTFRLEAWLENERGVRLSPYYELVFHRLNRPRHWGEKAPQSRFGIHTLPTHRHLTMAKAVGINWVRLHDAGLQYIGWYHLEREEGSWTFFDEKIERYANYDMSILGSLSTTPEWASHLSTINDSYFDRFYQPRDPDNFAAYAGIVAERYKDTIRHYDIWNEPWSPNYWAVEWSTDNPGLGYATSENPADDYVRLKEKAAAAVKKVDPEISIVGFDTLGTSAGRDWSRANLERDALEVSDIIGYHHHADEIAGFSGDVVERAFNLAISPIIDATNAETSHPVWLKEGSAARTAIGNGLYQHTVPALDGDGPTNARNVADNTARFTLSALASGAEKVFLYSMHRHGFFGNDDNWRSLVTPEGYLHPAGAAYSALTWHLDGLNFAKRLPLHDGAVSAYLFEGAERTVGVLARHPEQPGDYPVPAGEMIDAYDFLNNPLPEGALLGETLVFLDFEGTTTELEEVLRNP